MSVIIYRFKKLLQELLSFKQYGLSEGKQCMGIVVGWFLSSVKYILIPQRMISIISTTSLIWYVAGII